MLSARDEKMKSRDAKRKRHRRRGQVLFPWILTRGGQELAMKSNAQAVEVRNESVLIPTYEPYAPVRQPMFLDKRVYQGSSGKVYPLPFTDRVSTSKSDRAWRAILLENEYLQVMLLPEIGGRIHAILDKTNGYDAIYRQEVIKPAL